MLRWQNLPASALDGDLAASWDALNADRGDLPFLSAYVMVPALKEFGHGQERLLVGSDAQGPAAMLILWQKRFFEWQTFQPSQIPLGAWVARKELSLLEITRSVQRSLPGPCLMLGVTQVDPLLAARDADTGDSLSTDYIDTAWVDVAGDFAGYWSGRGKNLRQNMKKQRNKLVAEGIATTFRCLAKSEEMADAIACYGALESAGWKAQQGTAIHPDNAQGRFYTAVLEQACARNEGWVYEYAFNDKSVAVNLCVRRGETLVIFKTTYDETIKTFSPAFLLLQEALERLFAEGRIRRVEFFGKVMEWHTRWTEKSRTLYHLTVFRWGWLKRLHYSLATRLKGLKR
ncbi:MAG TPA: GNAT family N-acetyltransferase [Candidatus Competibacteraceae bacterium]|nr:GNAT family N-acetyltransferase [Candidatus Competibacteraceae bacterium]